MLRAYDTDRFRSMNTVPRWTRWSSTLNAFVILSLVLSATMTIKTRGVSMQELFEVRNISVSIHRPPSEVYAFITAGENIPQWAKGLGSTMRRVGGEWVAEGPLGNVKVLFAEPNDLGVADHDVVLETGDTTHNPIRVIPNGTGSTVIFTLMRLPGVSETAFNKDAEAVERDLMTLKAVLEDL